MKSSRQAAVMRRKTKRLWKGGLAPAGVQPETLGSSVLSGGQPTQEKPEGHAGLPSPELPKVPEHHFETTVKTPLMAQISLRIFMKEVALSGRSGVRIILGIHMET